MASHFAAIGFSPGPADTFETIHRIVTSCHRLTTPRGDYVPWRDGSGAEAWVQLDGMKALGFNPHFSGQSQIRCNITRAINSPNHSPLDASLHAWVNPDGDAAGDYPIVFDCPDLHVMAPLQFPHCTNVQLALFPEAVSVFANEADFDASQAGRPTQYASSSLIPSGLFGDPPPRPEVIAAGTITGIKHHTNKLTGLPFISAAFDTFGGVYDLVLPNAADTKELAIGNIVFGRFWVSGKIIRQAVPPPLP